MHFVIHTQYYPPEIGAPQARLSELAQGVVEKGHQVSVITAMPNYPGGKIYPGYGGYLRKEISGGVHIIRTAIFPVQTARPIPRLANYFSFVFSSLLLGGRSIESVDYILTESPPLFLGISGFLLSRWKKARWIFNISDLWPESAARLGLIGEGLPWKLSATLEGFCYRKAWMVTGQSKSILADVERRFPGVRTYHFSNGADTSRFHPDARTPEARKILCKNHDCVVALYAGLHGHAQGLGQMLQAAKEIVDPNLQLVFLGDGPEKSRLVDMAEELHLNNVRFLNPVSKEMMPSLVASADICLIPLKVFIPGAIPSKLYEAMACARPVILVAQGEAADIVSSSKAGIVVVPGDIEGIKVAMNNLLNNPKQREEMGMAGRRTAEIHFDSPKIVRQFADALFTDPANVQV